MKLNLINQIDNSVIDDIRNGNNLLADEYLKSLGYDLDEVNKLSERIYKQQSFLIRGMINKQKDKELLQKAALLVENTIKNKLEKPVAYINSLVKQNRFAVQYRNLDKLNKEEIIEIIKDQNLLEIIEKLCKQDEFDKINKSNIK